MWYLLAAFLALITLFLLTRIRVRCVIEEDIAFFFVGLGRTGFQYDLKSKTAFAKLFGVPIRLKRSVEEKPPREEKKEKTEKKPSTGFISDLESLMDDSDTIKQTMRALFRFGKRLLHRIEVEELHAHVTAGLSSPEQTGYITALYHALLGSVRSLRGRLAYTPVWDEAKFEFAGRMSVALPVYRTIVPLISLIRELPIRNLMQMIRTNRRRRLIWKTT